MLLSWYIIFSYFFFLVTAFILNIIILRITVGKNQVRPVTYQIFAIFRFCYNEHIIVFYWNTKDYSNSFKWETKDWDPNYNASWVVWRLAIFPPIQESLVRIQPRFRCLSALISVKETYAVQVTKLQEGVCILLWKCEVMVEGENPLIEGELEWTWYIWWCSHLRCQLVIVVHTNQLQRWLRG